MRSLLGTLLVVAGASVLGPGEPRATSHDFVADILPILQRQDCSSAYCHGSATGRGGLKLSLFGGDAAADYAALTVQFGGRRIDRRVPEQSLLVQKALGRLDHGGGRRVPRDSAAHRLLVGWIAAGAPWRAADAAELVDLDLELELTRAGSNRALLANATFRRGDGTLVVRDVTDLVLFGSTDPAVVAVDAEGHLATGTPGIATATARYGHRTAVRRLVAPFATGTSAMPSASAVMAAQPLDAAFFAHLRELNLTPAAAVSPARLARRLHQDLVGRPPTPQELARFEAVPDVPATVAGLLGGAEFAEVWGGHLARWLEVSAPAEVQRLIDALRRGDSVPQIATRVLDGSLGSLQRQSDPRDRAEYVGRTLLGVRIGCARCHDHPLDRWRQSEHLAFSACFASPRPDGATAMTDGRLFDPATGMVVPPKVPALGGRAARAADGDLRSAVRDFVLATEHDQLARNFANRVFAELLGRGLIEPVDDHRVGNPPRSLPMQDALVTAFHSHGGRLADVVALVATSAVYRLENEAGEPDDRALASSASPIPARWLAARDSTALSPEAYSRAVAAVVGGELAVRLPSSPLARELALRNGEGLATLLARGGTTIDAIFEFGGEPAERLDQLWLTMLSRHPRAAEQAQFLPLAAADVQAFRDLAHALLTGREFGHRR